MKGRIMVVDDEETVRKVLKKILEADGFAVVACKSGDEAIRQLKEERPEVVLLDMRMPGMDGLQTLQAIKDLSPASRIVMLTGLMDDATGREALQLGASDYLCKPVDADRLRETVSVFSLIGSAA